MNKRKGIGWGLGILLVMLLLPLGAFGQVTAEDFLNRGVAKWEKGDLDGAIADYTKAIELNPKFAAAYIYRAVAKAQKGDHDGGTADYAKAIGLDPKSAAELDPTNAAAYRNRGNIKNHKADYDIRVVGVDSQKYFAHEVLKSSTNFVGKTIAEVFGTISEIRIERYDVGDRAANDDEGKPVTQKIRNRIDRAKCVGRESEVMWSKALEVFPFKGYLLLKNGRIVPIEFWISGILIDGLIFDG